MLRSLLLLAASPWRRGARPTRSRSRAGDEPRQQRVGGPELRGGRPGRVQRRVVACGFGGWQAAGAVWLGGGQRHVRSPVSQPDVDVQRPLRRGQPTGLYGGRQRDYKTALRRQPDGVHDRGRRGLGQRLSVAARRFDPLLQQGPDGPRQNRLCGGPPIPGTLPNATSSTALHIGCTGAEFGSSAYGQYRPTTDASFDPATSVFTVNQTWFCDDESAARPKQITAVGSVKLPLSCVTTNLGGGNGTALTNKQCVPAAANISQGIVVTGRVVNEVALPAYSIEEPILAPDGCTASSILHPVWQFSAFGYQQKNGSSTVSGVNFQLILQTSNPGFQLPISITQGPKWSGNTTLPYPVGNATTTTTEPWYDCVIGHGGDDSPTLWPYACRFQYVPSTKQLSLVADWHCNDLDKAHPVTFSGRSTTVANKKVKCSPTTVRGVVNTEGLQTCVAADSHDAWTANITQISWTSSRGW